MASLDETNISLSLIKKALDSNENSLKTLSTDPSINIWSRKKPVRQHSTDPGEWYKGSNGDYSMFFSNCIGTLTSSYPTGNWEMNYPIDMYGYKIGDFRGYDPSANPFFYVSEYQSSEINLLASDAATFIIKLSDIDYVGIDSSSFESYNFDEWFPGVRLYFNSTYAYRTLDVSVSTGTSTELVFSLNDAPFNAWTGTYYWDAFIVDECISEVTTTPNNEACARCPSTYVYGVGYVPNQGSFNVVSEATVSIDDVSIYTDQSEWYDPNEYEETITVAQATADWHIIISSNTESNISLSNMYFVFSEALDGGDTPTPFQLTTNEESITEATPAGVALSFDSINTWADTAGALDNDLGPTSIGFSIKQGGVDGTNAWTGVLIAQSPAS